MNSLAHQKGQVYGDDLRGVIAAGQARGSMFD